MAYFYRSFFLQILRSTYNGSHPFFLDTLHACKRQLFWNIPECLQKHRTVQSLAGSPLLRKSIHRKTLKQLA